MILLTDCMLVFFLQYNTHLTPDIKSILKGSTLICFQSIHNHANHTLKHHTLQKCKTAQKFQIWTLELVQVRVWRFGFETSRLRAARAAASDDWSDASISLFLGVWCLFICLLLVVDRQTDRQTDSLILPFSCLDYAPIQWTPLYTHKSDGFKIQQYLSSFTCIGSHEPAK